MSWYEVVGYAFMVGFFWLAYKGWVQDTREMKRKVNRRRHG